MSTNIRGKVITSFKLNGLSLRSDASKLLVEVLEDVDKNDLDSWLKKIVDAVQKQPLESPMINRDIVELAINECNQGGEDETDKVFNVINVFKLPKFIYHNERKKFIPDLKPKLHLHGSADDKMNMFVERYTILHQRILHHDLFTPASVAASSNAKSSKFQLQPVEHLLGCSGSLEDTIVLGMLVLLKEGTYYLEDPTGVIELDLTDTNDQNATRSNVEKCFKMEQWKDFTDKIFSQMWKYDDQIFHVTALGFPPCEDAATTRSYFGNINFFGGPSTTCVANSEKLKLLEEDDNNRDNMFIFLSDLWLDQPKVVSKFRVLLSGYSQMPPALFVIFGNFLSQPYASKHRMTLRKCFQELGEIISEFPLLVQTSRFVFIPGPLDPGPGNIQPRPPLSRMLTEELRDKVPFAEFGTNPCRIQYCTQEIVVYREDIVNKLCRNSLHLPSDLRKIPEQFVKTILSQAHLCPLPLNIRPIYWNYDHTLRLYPLPDLIVCADKYEAYNIKSNDVICLNPGSFSRNDFCFKVYWPSTREVEDSKIN